MTIAIIAYEIFRTTDDHVTGAMAPANPRTRARAPKSVFKGKKVAGSGNEDEIIDPAVNMADYIDLLPNLASPSLGANILFATDEWFAAAGNFIHNAAINQPINQNQLKPNFNQKKIV